MIIKLNLDKKAIDLEIFQVYNKKSFIISLNDFLNYKFIRRVHKVIVLELTNLKKMT